jgi:two-component system KDP operon response regulator KdpE
MLHTTNNSIDLLVVDDGSHYASLAAAAKASGLQMSVAADGHTALQLATKRPPRVWMANLALADMSGVELMQLVRARRSSTPFYLISNRYSADDELSARTAGATGYLCKPVNSTWLEFCRAALARQPAQAANELLAPNLKHPLPSFLKPRLSPSQETTS